MNLSIRPARALGLAGLAALTMAAPASAATATGTATCALPLIGDIPVSFDITTPDTVVRGEAATFTLSNLTLDPRAANLAAKVELVAGSYVTVAPDGAPPMQLAAIGTLPNIPAASDTRVLTTVGNIKAPAAYVSLNFRATDAQGQPVILPDAKPFDYDGDPNTFWTDCFPDEGTAWPDITVTGSEVEDNESPSIPGGAKIDGITGTTATFSWLASTDNVGVAAYEVSLDGTKVATVNGTSHTFTGLTPATAYGASVVAVDTSGNRSQLATVTFKTASVPAPDKYTFPVSGSATIATLFRGEAALKGSLSLAPQLGSTAVRGNLTLSPATARLRAVGIVPVTAKIAFVESGSTTGDYSGGVLTTTSQVRIKVLEARLFGAIPLAGGNACQTKQLSKITLTGKNFAFSTGGKLTGSFNTSNLNGCGLLTGLVNSSTAAIGNTITVTAGEPSLGE